MSASAPSSAPLARITLVLLAGMSGLALAQTSADDAGTRTTAMNLQTMSWVTHQRFSAGLGVERTTAPRSPRPLEGSATGAAGAADAAVLVGVGVSLGRFGSNQPRLSWQAPVATMNGSSDDGRFEQRSQARAALSFDSQDRFAALRRAGALRLDLNSQTALAIKPRRGKVSVTLMSQW